MEEGTKSKKTVFVGGIGDDVDENVIYQNFATFGMCHVPHLSNASHSRPRPRGRTAGEVIEVQVPPAPTNPSNPNGARASVDPVQKQPH